MIGNPRPAVLLLTASDHKGSVILNKFDIAPRRTNAPRRSHVLITCLLDRIAVHIFVRALLLHIDVIL